MEMKKRFVKYAILSSALVFGAWASNIYADTDTGTLNVTANGIQKCRITDVTDVAFGDYDPTDPNPNNAGVGDFKFRCTKGTTYRLYITKPWIMDDGSGNNLPYTLHTLATRLAANAWPATFAEASDELSGSNAKVTKDIFGQIPALQDVPKGSYSDTDTITVEYTPVAP